MVCESKAIKAFLLLFHSCMLFSSFDAVLGFASYVLKKQKK